MLISRLPLVLAAWALFLHAPPMQAQEFSLSANQFPVGTKAEIAFSVPELEPQPVFDIGIARIGSETLAGVYGIAGAQSGAFELTLPVEPGPYQVVMKIRDGPAVQRVPVTLVFAPTPGALSLSANRATSGQKVTIDVRLEEGRYTNSPWVGLFNIGRNATGGASIADNRLLWEWLPDNGRVVFSMPRWPGTYEVRLFDRANGPYVLDRQQIEVVADPAPGMLSLDQQVYEVGEAMTVTAKLDRDRYFGSVWVGIFRPSATLNGGARREESRLTWEWLNKEEMTVNFRAPRFVGAYEVRIFDGDGLVRFELDRVSFDVQASPQPGAIGLERSSFIIGESIAIPITLAPDRFYDSPWLGLFETAGAPGVGDARRSLRRLVRDWATTEQSVTFAAPEWPGTYQLRLYDRNASFYMIDTYDITVTAPATPGAISLNKTIFEVGEPIVVTFNLDSGRYYASPWYGIFNPGSDQVAGGAGVDRTQLYRNWVSDGQPDTMPGISEPGIYEVRLFDRNGSGFVLDTAKIEVVATNTPNVLSTDKEVYKTGETVTINVDIPQPRFLASPWVGLFLADAYGNDNAPVDPYLNTRDWISVGGGPYTLSAPLTQGTYRIAAFDRNVDGLLLGEKIISVVSEPEDLLRIQRRVYAPGETIKFQTRWPDGLNLSSPKVSMFSTSFVTGGGGLAVELPIQTRFVNRGREEVEFPAPTQEGSYELRFLDRNDYFYILDIEAFTVQDAAMADAARRPVRLTPMPGEARVGPITDEGLPGAPRLPSDNDERESGEAGGDETDTGSGEPDTANNDGDGSPASEPADTRSAENDDGGDGGDQDNETAQPPDLAIVVVGPGGFVNVTKLAPGQSFLVEARFASPPENQSPMAQVSLGEGKVMNVTLRPEGDSGVYRSSVIRIPTGNGG